MNITPEEVERFKETWRQEFEEQIGEDEASQHILRLDALYLMLSEQIPMED